MELERIYFDRGKKEIGDPLFFTKMKYAVVSWYNYRKELSAGFIKGFDEFEKAKEFAYSRAKEDWDTYETYDQVVITEDDITDGNGPGKSGSPYHGRTIIGYGGRNSDGYSTEFYCVVEWFDGVENSWDDFEDSDYWGKKYGSQWYPKYSY
jgi:hypothetical protein